MKVSLVISTYNWKEALCLCLLSVTRQTVIPTEVIIADDGSRSDTKLLIEEFKNLFLVPSNMYGTKIMDGVSALS